MKPHTSPLARRRRFSAALLVCVALTIAGCSSPAPKRASPGPPTGAGPTAPSSTAIPTAAGNPTSPPSTAPSVAAQASAPAAPPPSLDVFTVLSEAGLPAALGTAVKGYEDDGGYTDANTSAYTSAAQTETALTHLQVQLLSFASPADAAEIFPKLAGQGRNPLPGVGDKAVESDDETAVLKGSQILVVKPSLTQAGTTYVVQADKSPASIAAALEKPGIATATAIASHLTGAVATSTYLGLPDGAVNPCATTAAALTAAANAPSTVANALSETPPWQQCDYEINGQPFLSQTYSAAQAANAVPATSLQAQFTSDEQQQARGHIEATVGPFQAFANLDEDWTVEVLLTPATPSASSAENSAFRLTTARLRTAGAAHESSPRPLAGLIMVRVMNGYTFIVNVSECIGLMDRAVTDVLEPDLDSLPTAVADLYGHRLFDQVVDWCKQLQQVSPGATVG